VATQADVTAFADSVVALLRHARSTTTCEEQVVVAQQLGQHLGEKAMADPFIGKLLMAATQVLTANHVNEPSNVRSGTASSRSRSARLASEDPLSTYQDPVDGKTRVLL
jgi:hypothetical protein